MTNLILLLIKAIYFIFYLSYFNADQLNETVSSLARLFCTYLAGYIKVSLLFFKETGV